MPPPPTADIPLPVLSSRPGRRWSRWRVWSLLSVHVLILAHITHWAISGRSVASVQLSDAMNTLELGRINPGFLLFAAALLITLLFGRFFCGWACHMGALQDATAWILRRCGIRPAPIRSRLLGFIPLGLALYMFVWPTFKRDLLLPVIHRSLPALDAYFKPVPPFPGLTAELTTSDLFARLPGALIALPFLLVCGCATVYFLGARGLCRFGCPYAGVLTTAAHISPVTITVDPSRCDGCGRCTAACTQHVRVLDETSRFGAVVSASCIRSLDCIDACPHQALSLHAGPPAAVRGLLRKDSATAAQSLPLRHDVLLLACFLLSLTTLRGLYGMIPLLMAVAIALCLTGALHQFLMVLSRPNAAFRRLQLKRNDTFTAAGRTALSILGLAAAFMLHSACVRIILWHATTLDDRITVPRNAALRGEVPESVRSSARRALAAYTLGSGIGSGGIALHDTPWVTHRIAWLQIVAGDFDAAEQTLACAADRSRSPDALHAEIATVHAARGDIAGAIAQLTVRTRHASTPMPRSTCLLAELFASLGDLLRAERVLREFLDRAPDEPTVAAALGSLLLATERPVEAVDTLSHAARLHPGDPALARVHAISLHAAGRTPDALIELDRATRLDPGGASHDADLAAEWRASGDQ